MTIENLLKDKETKAKEKTTIISNWLLEKSLPVDELIAFAEKQKDPVKATCMEAAEYATKENPQIATESLFDFACESLTQKAPRLKWESAKVIGNIAFLYPDKLKNAIQNLIENTNHEGTVVRWSAAFALGEILKLQTKHNVDLLKTVEAICESEEKNSIKKIYNAAIKKLSK
ncbi:HEAT repeat domain-containing protein [Flavobacterium dauae]|uniref:HEAT repeat domain-containing protein n=1 Tax=Flavobacterium dauae TaxID=1563479 RepID=UPI00101B4DC4|nr:HEAT repeat domain-containing protein [Flavobacterium dauae]WLD24228.1 HEAT repeat domain-containing protein [Flavobacterium dauae]